MSCHVGRLRIRRKGAKTGRYRAPGLSSLATSAELAGAPFPGHAKHGLGAFGGALGAAAAGGQGFPGGAGVAGLFARGAGQSDLAALAALGGLGGLGGLAGLGGFGGFGGFNPDGASALGNLAELSASHTTATMNKLVALNAQLRQQNAELQHCTMQLVRQLEREARCAACQKSRLATNGAGAGAGAGPPEPRSRPDAGPSSAEALDRVAAGSRVEALLSSLRGGGGGSESPTTLDAKTSGGVADGADGEPSALAGADAPSPRPEAAFPFSAEEKEEEETHVAKRLKIEAPAEENGAPESVVAPETDAEDAAGAGDAKGNSPESS